MPDTGLSLILTPPHGGHHPFLLVTCEDYGMTWIKYGCYNPIAQMNKLRFSGCRISPKSCSVNGRAREPRQDT
jgi:hypothetical protein